MNNTITPYLLSIIIFFFACNERNQKSSELPSIESAIDLTNTGSNCGFETILSDENTPKLAKDIFLGNAWKFSSDTEAIALLDSMNSMSKASRHFYFKVLTKAYDKADGYFSEGLGTFGSDFIKNHTTEFAGFFDNEKCFTQGDLQTWSEIVLLEFSIEEDNYQKHIIENYSEILIRNCITCSPRQKETITLFTKMLKDKWNAYLKNLE